MCSEPTKLTSPVTNPGYPYRASRSLVQGRTNKGLNAMKMTQEHYTTLKNAIQALGIERTSAIRIWSRKTCDEKPKLNFDKLFRHTMLYDAVRSKWVCDELYPYLDDTHIDTALRRIVKDLNL